MEGANLGGLRAGGQDALLMAGAVAGEGVRRGDRGAGPLAITRALATGAARLLPLSPLVALGTPGVLAPALRGAALIRFGLPRREHLCRRGSIRLGFNQIRHQGHDAVTLGHHQLRGDREVLALAGDAAAIGGSDVGGGADQAIAVAQQVGADLTVRATGGHL